MRSSVVCFAMLSCAWAQSRAEWQQAYLFAYPLVLMDVTREASAVGGSNTLAHTREFPNDRFRTVVRPNADTLYSTAWLDLSKEPVLLRMPDTGGRYYLMQLLDAWTETIAVPGKRTTGTGEGWFAITGPGWKGKLPAAVQHRFESPTNLVWLLGRLQTNGPTDFANVHKLQDGMRLMPLSRFPDGVAGPRATRAIAGAARPIAASKTPPQLVAEMSDEVFFARFRDLLKANPMHPADTAMLAIVEKLAVPETLAREEFQDGVKSAKAMLAVVEQLRTTAAGASGWTALNPNIGRYGTNYTARAVVARVGLGANPPEDAVYLSCYKDPTGKPLEGAFRIHFDARKLPPVEAFWSITVYDAAGYFVANPEARYAIGDRDKLKFNPDGSLDLYLQPDPPAETDRRANWLPVPARGTFNLSFRLYWPKSAVLEGKWVPPPVLREK